MRHLSEEHKRKINQSEICKDCHKLTNKRDVEE